MAITGDQRLLKRINRMALVRLVRDSPGASRADLSSETGLTKSTVSLLVQELIDEGWICEDKVLVTGAIGRRPTPLRLDQSRLALIGVEIAAGRLNFISMSLDGEIFGRHVDYFELSESTSQAVLDLVVSGLQVVMAQCAADKRSVLGVGVGCPGAVEGHGGMITSPSLSWKQEPIAPLLRTALNAQGLNDLPLFLQNDCAVAALGEIEFTSRVCGDPLLFLGMGETIGAGVVVRGRLLHGARGAAGDIGHMQLEASGPDCNCGRSGCAEVYLGLRSLADKLQCGVDELLLRVKSGDSTVESLLSEAGRRFGLLMHNLWVMLDPGAIVLGGRGCALGSVFLDSARDVFNELAKSSGIPSPDISVARYGESAVAAGAAALVLHELLLPI